MRIKISLEKRNFKISIAYQTVLQGLIYNLLAQSNLSDFYHNQGYKYQNKVFKCFTFSQLFGKYHIDKDKIVFDNMFYFYISSQDELFLKEIYKTLSKNNYLLIEHQRVIINQIDLLYPIKPFTGNNKLMLQTLSPILICSTTNNYTTYYSLSDNKSNELIINNIKNKSKAYDYPISNIYFEIQNIVFEKRRMTKYKNCYYLAYLSKFEVLTNYETFLFVYNCGLSSKNSCGFGMIDICQ